MLGLLVFLFAMLIPPFVIANWAAGRFMGWPGWTVALVSSALVPAILMIPVALIVISALTSTKEQCGVDACGMAIGFGLTAAVLIAILFGISFLINAVVVYRSRSKAPVVQKSTFE